MAYSLAQAAEAVGMARSSILRAIKAGKISAVRDENNEWQIEPAELHRVYPAPAAATTRTDERTDELIAELRARLDDMRTALATATANAETWRAAFEREQAQRALPAPGTDTQQGTEQHTTAWRRTWRWLRTTG